MQKSDSIGALAKALSELQAEMQDVRTDSKNPFFNSTYASLGAVLQAARPLLHKHGLSLVQLTTVFDEQPRLVTMLMHSSGEWLSGDYPLIPSKNDPQGLSAAVTYGRRTTLKALLGIAEEDDDGNSISSAQPKAPAKPSIDLKTNALQTPTLAMQNRLIAIADKAGFGINDVIGLSMKKFSLQPNKISRAQYDELCAYYADPKNENNIKM
jgi:hypothetical protein